MSKSCSSIMSAEIAGLFWVLTRGMSWGFDSNVNVHPHECSCLYVCQCVLNLVLCSVQYPALITSAHGFCPCDKKKLCLNHLLLPCAPASMVCSVWTPHSAPCCCLAAAHMPHSGRHCRARYNASSGLYGLLIQPLASALLLPTCHIVAGIVVHAITHRQACKPAQACSKQQVLVHCKLCA